MSAYDGTVFVAGEFDSIGGTLSPRMAQVDGVTGQTMAWRPATEVLSALRLFDARAILSDGATVFVGGWQYDLRDHLGLLAFDTSGDLVPWAPTLVSEYHMLVGGDRPMARALALHGNTLFVGGKFDTIGSVPRPNLAAIDASTGVVLPWNSDMRGGFPQPFDAVDALLVTDGMLYVGGRFPRLGGYPSRGFAALGLAPGGASLPLLDAPPPPGGVSLALAPNPARGRIRVTFSIPTAATVDVSVFDIAGRRVAAPLRRSRVSAGDHTLWLDSTRLRAGVYYCRLDAGLTPISRRFVVLE
jgi:hypothetical protein